MRRGRCRRDGTVLYGARKFNSLVLWEVELKIVQSLEKCYTQKRDYTQICVLVYFFANYSLNWVQQCTST